MTRLKTLPELSDTICAVATPLGHSAIGIIRMSGHGAHAIVKRILQLNTRGRLRSKYFVNANLINPETLEKIDTVCCVYMKAPRTYTGEDVVEIYSHGNPHILEEIIQILVQNGCRLAEPGEFTFRAFSHGKMDLTQAEAIAELINSDSQVSQRVAYRQTQGELFQRVVELKEELIKILAHLEACLDFEAEGDVIDRGIDQKVYLRLVSTQKEVLRLKQSYKEGKILAEGLRIVIVGRPNVGKSSLFNAFLDRERAIVTPIPGTTRDTLCETRTFSQIKIEFTDTAGLHLSGDPIEKEGMLRTHAALDFSDALFFVVDGSVGWTKEDEEIFKLLDKNKKIFVLINKADLPQQKVNISEGFLVSAKTKTGLEEVKTVLLKEFIKQDVSNPELLLTNARHLDGISKTHLALERAVKAFHEKMGPEFISHEVYEAINALGEITGETTSEEIIQKIFSEFCIGK